MKTWAMSWWQHNRGDTYEGQWGWQNSPERQHRWQENVRTIASAPTSRIDESFENSFGSKKWA
jgi:hypothetical protein